MIESNKRDIKRVVELHHTATENDVCVNNRNNLRFINTN